MLGVTTRRITVLAVLAALCVTAVAATQATAAPASSRATLTGIRDRVDSWLDANGFTTFKVDEVMAFTNNDYAAVADKTGKPAFELLVAADGRWLMEEPASMMWNTKYGMLPHASGTVQPSSGLGMMWGTGMTGSGRGGPRSWSSRGSGPVSSLAQAVTAANRWLAKAHPAESAESDGRGYPGYYTLDTVRNGKTFGMLSINRVSGAVWYHGWHGRFLAEQRFSG